MNSGITKAAKRLAQALLLAALLSSCAGQRESPAAAEPQRQEAEPPRQEARTDVENNGGSYVRVGEKVYFRRYGAGALQKTALFGEFTASWNTGTGESELMALDLTTGALDSVWTETGTGALWYGDGGFYLDERVNGGDRVVWFAPDGSEAEELCPGKPLGITEDGLLAVERVEASPTYRTLYCFYRDKKLLSETVAERDYEVAGLSAQGLFLLGGAAGGGENGDGKALCLWQLTPEGTLLCLGALPETEDEFGFYAPQADDFLAAGDKVAVCVGYYAGTGHFLNEYAYVEAVAGQENSLSELTLPEIQVDGSNTLPRLAIGGSGSFELVPFLPGELRIGWEETDDGDLELWEDGDWRALSKGLCPPVSDGRGYRRVVQHMDYVDGAAYVTLACAHASPIDSIGWRDACLLLDMLYLRIERSGEERELSCVDHGTELYGYVWQLEGTDTLLWQQLNSEDDGWFEAGPAYAVPLADTVEWLDGRESVFSGEAGSLPADYGRDEANYYGYPAPDTEPAASVCLSLDRDGRAVSVVRKDPAALLSIEFDVPQQTGAIKTLPLDRRDSDEDTPWFWAKLTSLEDGTQLRIERTAEYMSVLEEIAETEGAFIAGTTAFSGTLNRGEFVLLRAALPWHPELRVSVSKDGSFGSYIFGEDNYLHWEAETGVHPPLTLAAYPPSHETEEESLRAALQGTWLYREPQSGEVTALLRFDSENNLFVETTEEGRQFGMMAEHLYTEPWEMPDLLCIRSETEAGVRGEGDYLVQLFRTDGEELLFLTQANNGDGILSALVPGSENVTSFVFRRDSGAAQPGAHRRSASFPAMAVRYDGESGILWMQEAEIVDEYPDGGAIRRANPDAPCLPYPIDGAVAAAALGYGKVLPMEIFNVTVNRNAEIERLDPSVS